MDVRLWSKHLQAEMAQLKRVSADLRERTERPRGSKDECGERAVAALISQRGTGGQSDCVVAELVVVVGLLLCTIGKCV